jgi:hypothetical protein
VDVLPKPRHNSRYKNMVFWGIHTKRDKLPSIAYSEELIFSISATLQSTDQHHGMVGQKCCHFQLDS